MITQKELKEIVHYEPSTGEFTWVACRSTKVKPGDKAGCIDKSRGYLRVRIDYKYYLGHRLAWLYMKGYHPEHEIDHINGIRHDNRWFNLRHVTHQCNMQNQKVHSRNTSGFTGVSLNKKCSKWAATIMINQRAIYLGSYDSPLEAALARYTVEDQCSKWTCNYRSKLVQAIQKDWPDFKIME